MADINLGVGGANSATGGYDIDNSCKFEADNVEKMTHTYDSAPTSQKKGTISMWFKRTEIGSNIGLFQFGDDASGNYLSLRWGRDIYGSLETYGMRLGGTNFSVGNSYGAIRDTSAWYHVVIAIDTTQATSTNRFKVYRNGVEPGWSTDNTSNITQNADLAIGENGKDIMIGEGVYRYNGYIAEVHYVDGQQLTSADFGEYDDDSGIWKPKAYTGTYGNNGFYLDFSNASNLGEDQSGNNHDFTLSNITAADQATDTPTNNFCTFNTLAAIGTAISSSTYTEGGTVAQANKQNDLGEGTMMFSNGNWYFEMQVPSSSSTADAMFGFGVPNEWGLSGSNPGNDYKSFAAHTLGRWYFNNNGHTSTDSSAAFAKGDIVSIAINTSSQKAWIAVNGTWATGTNPATGTGGFSYGTLITNWESGDYLVPAFRTHFVSGSKSNANFGGYTVMSISSAATDENGYGTFEYAPPSGYYALCTKNLAEYG